jgi:hypothetical protein
MLAPVAVLLALVPTTAWAQQPAKDYALPFLFLLFVVAVGAVVGRWIWTLRRDFVGLLNQGEATDPLARATLFRDSSAGLPEGTIRAALALLVVAILLPALVLSSALGLSGTGEIGTILGGILGFYFGTRSGGGEAEGFRRQAESFMQVARTQEAAARTAEDARVTAEQAAATARAEATSAAAAVEGIRTAAIVETQAQASQASQLEARARDALAVARAVAGLLPAGGAVAGTIATAAATLEEAVAARPAIERALADPNPASIAAALGAARATLARAGEGSELAERLGGVLGVLQQASSAAATLRGGPPDPAALMAEAAALLGRTEGAGLPGLLAPTLSAVGTAMRVVNLAGGLTPVGVAGGLMLGAWQAAAVGQAHYARWMARVLDRPVTPELVPTAAWDGAVAGSLIRAVPPLARAYATELSTASQAELARILAMMFAPDAATTLFTARRDAFASAHEADAAVADLRRLVLDQELDRDAPGPVPLPGGEQMPQAQFRVAIDRLREAGAGPAIEELGLLTGRLVRPAPGIAPPDLPRLLAAALPEAAALPAATPAAPPEPKP